MQPTCHSPSTRRGSALITVIFLTTIFALLTASMLTYTLSEKRGNERNRVQLRAKNMAENISVYAAEQLTTKLYRTRATTAMAFMASSDGSNEAKAVQLPDSSGNNNVLSGVKFATVDGMEVRAGMLAPTAYATVTDTSDSNYGLQVSTATVPIIAKATMTNSTVGAQTAYVLQEMEIAMTPMFQFGLFYNMDLELFPGQDMTIMGPVHTNGRLMARGEVGGTADVTFSDRVSAAQGLYADGQMKVAYRNRAGGNTAGAGGSGAVYYTKTNGSTLNLYNSSIWKDHKYGNSSESATTLNNFKSFTTTNYGTNVRTNVHGVTKLELPGIGSYSETDLTTTPEDDRSNGRQIIEPPNPKKWDGDSWETVADDADSRESKISWKAGLYIAVNPDDTTRAAVLPNGNTAYVLGQSYRAWLNTIDSSNNHTVTEVVLPGQPSYGYNAGADGVLNTADDYMYRNNLPNHYTTGTTVGSNQVLRIPQQAYGTGTGYLVNNSSGYAVGDTVLSLDSGTGTIRAGDTISIDTLKYTVHSALAGGSITLASPLRAAVADNTPVYVDGTASFAGTGAGYLINKSGGYAINTGGTSETLALDTGSGTILSGNSVTIGSFKYLVTASLNNATVTLGRGVRAAVADNVAVNVDPLSGTRGTGNGYLISGSHGSGTTSLALDTGSGTIWPGNTLIIAGNRYTVTSAPVNGLPSSGNITISPGLYAAAADNTAVALGWTETPGYTHNTGTGTGYLLNGAKAVGSTAIAVDTGSGTIEAGDILTIGSTQYTVHSPLSGGTVALVSPGLTAAAADNAAMSLEALSGPIFPAENDSSPFPSDSYFYDMRRARGNQGYGSNVSSGSARSTTNYVPRAIAKIDFDMARFKMMIARSVTSTPGTTVSNAYKLQLPDAGNWTNSIFNSGATATTLDLGIDDPSASGVDYSLFPPAGGGTASEAVRQDPFRLFYAPTDPTAAATITAIYSDPRTYIVPYTTLYDGNSPDAWFDGLAVYLNSLDAEVRGLSSGVPTRVDSGVRFINGRGPVASLGTTGATGCTIATNDAAYIIGHFNADGTVQTSTSSTGNGGYSARYPDSSNEKLVAVMADAITMLSQPEYSTGTAPYSQSNGWNDALSAFRFNTSTWSTNWRSSQPGSSNNYEGLGSSATAIRPGMLPNSSIPGGAGSTRQTKLPPPADTEYSVALLVGIVPSNHDASTLTDGPPTSGANGQYSGGAHNFPRLLEDWHCDMGSGNNAKLFIRGSMVALFESRVAMEPWNIRTYAAPDRYWGLHENLRTAGHDVPLEPIVLACNRKRYMEYNATEYAAMKTTIEALPH